MARLLLSVWVVSAHAASTSELRRGLDATDGWAEVARKSVADVGEIVIRHKEVSGVPCLEGTVTSSALPVDTLARLAADIDHQPSWSSWEIPLSAKLDGGTTSFDYYQVLDNPSPIADRYWFLHGATYQSGESRVFSWELVDPSTKWPAALAQVREKFPSAVMTSVNVGDWTFTPVSVGTRVRYRICTDAGGNIPRWMGEYAATRTLPTNVADIIQEVRRRIGR